jgi:hypothetical protein
MYENTNTGTKPLNWGSKSETDLGKSDRAAEKMAGKLFLLISVSALVHHVFPVAADEEAEVVADLIRQHKTRFTKNCNL